MWLGTMFIQLILILDALPPGTYWIHIYVARLRNLPFVNSHKDLPQNTGKYWPVCTPPAINYRLGPQHLWPLVWGVPWRVLCRTSRKEKHSCSDPLVRAPTCLSWAVPTFGVCVASAQSESWGELVLASNLQRPYLAQPPWRMNTSFHCWLPRPRNRKWHLWKSSLCWSERRRGLENHHPNRHMFWDFEFQTRPGSQFPFALLRIIIVGQIGVGFKKKHKPTLHSHPRSAERIRREFQSFIGLWTICHPIKQTKVNQQAFPEVLLGPTLTHIMNRNTTSPHWNDAIILRKGSQKRKTRKLHPGRDPHL